MIDRQILFVLDAARRHAESLKRTVPFSITKVEARATFLYWSAQRKLLRGKNIYVEKWKRRD